jgi:hypothetical protein
MTARQLIDSPTLRIAAYALVLGIAWATLESKVAQKADKAEVQAAVDTIRDNQRRIGADVRDIKYILCGPRNTDSFCRAR